VLWTAGTPTLALWTRGRSPFAAGSELACGAIVAGLGAVGVSRKGPIGISATPRRPLGPVPTAASPSTPTPTAAATPTRFTVTAISVNRRTIIRPALQIVAGGIVAPFVEGPLAALGSTLLGQATDTARRLAARWVAPAAVGPPLDATGQVPFDRRRVFTRLRPLTGRAVVIAAPAIAAPATTILPFRRSLFASAPVGLARLAVGAWPLGHRTVKEVAGPAHGVVTPRRSTADGLFIAVTARRLCRGLPGTLGVDFRLWQRSPRVVRGRLCRSRLGGVGRSGRQARGSRRCRVGLESEAADDVGPIATGRGGRRAAAFGATGFLAAWFSGPGGRGGRLGRFRRRCGAQGIGEGGPWIVCFRHGGGVFLKILGRPWCPDGRGAHVFP